MLPENDRFRDFLGVTRWHKAGYTGKRGLSVTGENLHRGEQHAYETAFVFHEIAPDRELVYLGEPNHKWVFVQDFEAVAQRMYDRKADTMFMSYEGRGDGIDAATDKLMPFCSIDCSAGNQGTDTYTEMIDCKNVFGIGAYILMYPDNQISPAPYSAYADSVDYCAPTMLTVQYESGAKAPFAGTSCAAPVLAAMCSLINDFFIDKTGKPLSSEMMYQFLKDNSRDIGVKGKDNKCGWGAPILPPPDSIDIRRYAGEMLNSRDIDLLRPDVAANCKKLIAIAKADGWPVLVTGTVRDKEFQEYCYYKGTSKSKVPTFHSEAAGLAFDICKNIKGQEYSDNAFWDYCGALGKRMGFTWGGDWKSFVDKPHFQWDCHGRYSGNDILVGWYPPPMPLFEQEDEMTQEQFNAMYDKINPTYATLEDIPSYWREETQALIDSGKLKGTGEGKLNIRHETLRAVIIGER